MAQSPRSNDADGLLSLPRPVWLLGWVSLATDSATEAIYPLLPFFLTRVLNAGAVSLGIVEGVAEAVNSLLKIWSGYAADRHVTRRPFVLAGYSISSLVRPLIGFAQSWPQVFAVRVCERVGKGIRTAPRDAILAAAATPDTRGKVYGFHRGMDHAGAVIGPIAATLFLHFYPGSYRTLFGLTIFPGLVAIGLIFLVRESEAVPVKAPGTMSTGGQGISVAASASGIITSPHATPLPGELKAFFGVLALFTLGNSTDAFLLLKLTDVAGSAEYIPLVWAALHVVKAGVSLVGGSWSDRVGRRRVIALGWLVFAAVYLGFAVSTSLLPLLAWFLVYGCYFGFTEAVEKALVADLAPADARGFAFGVYDAVLGLGALLASVIFGLLWNAFGPGVAFGIGSALALLATALLFAVVRR